MPRLCFSVFEPENEARSVVSGWHINDRAMLIRGDEFDPDVSRFDSGRVAPGRTDRQTLSGGVSGR